MKVTIEMSASEFKQYVSENWNDLTLEYAVGGEGSKPLEEFRVDSYYDSPKEKRAEIEKSIQRIKKSKLKRILLRYTYISTQKFKVLKVEPNDKFKPL